MHLQENHSRENSGRVQVIHRHRIGRSMFARVSDLTYSDGRPLAILTWLHDGDARMPGVCVQLDPAKLRAGSSHRVFFYDGVTEDPRFLGPNASISF